MNISSRRAMGKGAKQLILIIAVIAVIAIATHPTGTGSVAPPNGNSGSSTPPNSNSGAFCSSQGGSSYCGQVTANVAHYNSLSITSSLTEGTNVVTTWYRYSNGIYKGVGSGTAVSFAVDQTDGGFVYAVLQPVSGQNYYLDFQKTLSANSPRMVSLTYTALTTGAAKVWLAKISTTNLALSAGQTTANFYITAYWYPEATMSLNSPSAITSIGTTASTSEVIQWQMSFNNNQNNVAMAFYKVEVKVSTTNTAKWDITQSTLSLFGQNVPLANFVQSTDGTNTYYDLTYGTGFDVSQYYTLASTGTNNFNSNLKLVLSLSSGNSLTWTLTYWPLLPAGTIGTTITNSVVTSA